MDRVFLQAAMATPPTVLGVRLRPLSIGHAYLLRAIGSPFTVGGSVDRTDLAAAVLICSRGWHAGRALLMGEHGGLETAAYRLGESVQTQTADMPEDEREAWFRAELDRFDDYLELYREIPEHYTTGNEKSYRGPWEWHAVRMLCQNGLARSKTQAWNTPLNEAMCWRAVVVEHQGDDSIQTQRDRELTAMRAADLLKANDQDYAKVAELMSSSRFKLTADDVRRFLIDLPGGAADG